MKEGIGGEYNKLKKEFYFGEWYRDLRTGHGLCFSGIVDENLSNCQTVYKGFWLHNAK